MGTSTLLCATKYVTQLVWLINIHAQLFLFTFQYPPSELPNNPHSEALKIRIQNHISM